MMFMRDSICMIFKLPHNHKSMLCHFRYEMNHLFSQKNYPHVQHLDTLILYLGLASENELLPNRLKAQPPCFVIWDFEDWSWRDPSKELKFPMPIPTTQTFCPCKCKGCPWKRVCVLEHHLHRTIEWKDSYSCTKGCLYVPWHFSSEVILHGWEVRKVGFVYSLQVVIVCLQHI